MTNVTGAFESASVDRYRCIGGKVSKIGLRMGDECNDCFIREKSGILPLILPPLPTSLSVSIPPKSDGSGGNCADGKCGELSVFRERREVDLVGDTTLGGFGAFPLDPNRDDGIDPVEPVVDQFEFKPEAN